MGKLLSFLIKESISGEARKVKAETPAQALVEYLKDEIEPNPHTLEWDWEFHVTRIRR